MTLASAVLAQARCATPEGLALVDAAFRRPTSKAQTILEREVCPTCPIWDACLRDALDSGEHGPWGGTSERRRRTNPKARRPYNHNLRGIHAPDKSSPGPHAA